MVLTILIDEILICDVFFLVLIADLLTVVSDRIARAFNRCRATQAVALDIQSF